jgi:DnaJ-class molecular chaperone
MNPANQSKVSPDVARPSCLATARTTPSPGRQSARGYTILGVSEYDSLDTIKKRYRSLAMRNHPDRGGDPAKFSEIKQAYEEIVKTKKDNKGVRPFDVSSDTFFKKMFGSSLGPWK